MSKANQKFVQADEAVSPVIGVILMVAITVVLAAVVFVLVSNLSKTSDKSEEAAVTSRSPTANVLEITLVKSGDHAPYTLFSDESAQPAYATVSINGVMCNFGTQAATPPGSNATVGITAPDDWIAGGVLRIVGTPLPPTTPKTCVDEVVGGTAVSVTVSVAGTLIQSTTVDIRQ